MQLSKQHFVWLCADLNSLLNDRMDTTVVKDVDEHILNLVANNFSTIELAKKSYTIQK